MPLEVDLINFKVYKENPQSVEEDLYPLRKALVEREDSFNDLQLTWEGDLNFDEIEEDLKVFSSLDSFIQRVYLFLKTQVGTLPSDENFGTVIENFVGKNDIPIKPLAFKLKSDLERLEGVDFVDDVSLTLARVDYHRILLVEISLKPADFDFKISLLFAAKEVQN